MSALATISPASASASGATLAPPTRLEELGQIIQQYSEVTQRLQISHDQLQQTVKSLRNDLAQKNRELERRNRMAALGEMAAGMAHEIRNPLGGIQLYASLLAKDVSEQPQPLTLVNKISAGVTHLERVVSQVLQFTRQITAHRELTDVAEVMSNAIDMAAPTFQTLGVACDAGGPRPLRVNVDPQLLSQAALNLLLNAAEALAQTKDACVTVRWAAAGRGEGRRLRLTVSDNGPGVPANLLDKIFNPFFTTKDTGTGLGLAVVHRIVEAHDGTVRARNRERGAEFEVKL